MTRPVRKRPRPAVLLSAVGIATLLALGVAEVALRLFVGPTPPLGTMSFADSQGTPVPDAPTAAKRGLLVPLPGKIPDVKPRPRWMFKPNEMFYICYADNDVLNRDWLDAQGRVANHINSHGLRERQMPARKPAGQRRIICLGDSFTFGWGIRPEDGWVRLLEEDLRKDKGDVRTVNCGACASVCVDEYWAGLKNRFGKFEPDAVIMTLCLNDLVPSHALSFLVPDDTGIRVLDLVRAAMGASPLRLDPDTDWVQWLLDLDQKEALALGLCGPDKPFEAMWSQGVPQQCMREAKAWCDERKIPFLVVVWPFLQGLGPGEYYPFQKLHDLVAADLSEAGIPLLDVKPILEQTPQEDLWVTPADPHPNPLSQRLALPAIAKFVRSHIGW